MSARGGERVHNVVSTLNNVTNIAQLTTLSTRILNEIVWKPLARGVDLKSFLNASFECRRIPMKFEEMESTGSYGTMFRVLLWPSGPQLVAKVQEDTRKAKKSLQDAAKLVDCNLVNFRTVEMVYTVQKEGVPTTGGLLVTFMPMADGDCSKLVLPDYAKPQFSEFMRKLEKCLRDHSMTFADMKLGNIGYKKYAPRNYEFRLLDLDGINQNVATFPVTAEWYQLPGGGRLQTQYAFGVAFFMMFTDDLDRRKEIVGLLSHVSFNRKYKNYKSHEDRIRELNQFLFKCTDWSMPSGRAVGKLLNDAEVLRRQNHLS